MRIIIDVPDECYLNLEEKCQEIKFIYDDDVSVESVIKSKLHRIFGCCECDMDVNLNQDDLLLILNKMDKFQINISKPT